jgi:hypothetical protein
VAQIPPLAPLHGVGTFSPLIACPEHSALIPNGGAAAGGTQVLLTGSGFTGATAVSFGAAAAASFHVVDDHLIVAVSPGGTGTVGITVTASVGSQISAGEFSYFGVTRVDTTSGPFTGGTSVVLHGYGFTGVQNVTFGLMPAQSFTVVSPTEIDAVAPPGLGTVDVQVINSVAPSAVDSSDMFVYQGGPPGSSSINEGTGPAAAQSLAAQMQPFCFPDPVDQALCTTARWVGQHLLVPALAAGVTVAELIAEHGEAIFDVIQSITDVCAGAGSCTAFLLAAIDAAGPAILAAAPAILAAAVGVVIGEEIYFLLKRYCSPGGLWGLCNLFIDPSGTVIDTHGNPIRGAVASLLGQLAEGEPFSLVPESSGAFEPAENPEKTDASGQFDWNALAGTYEVEASAAGCHAPGEGTQPDVFTSPFVLPPPAVGLMLTLECAGGTAPMPKVTGLSVAGGATAGGNVVDIEGEGLAGVTAIHFGDNASVHVQPLSPYAVAAVVPAGIGTVDVTASGAGGTSATGQGDRYTYSAPLVTESSPVIESVAPNGGPVSGGTAVTIRGNHLDSTFAVEFGGTSSTQVTPISATEVQAVAPAAAFPVRVDVAVTTPNGTSAPMLADSFTYGSPLPPVATSVTITPSPNPVTAGQQVTLTAVITPVDGGGIVAFYADGSATPLGGCGAQALTQAGGTYQTNCSTASLGVGSHTISAAYSGDASYAASLGSASVSVVEPLKPPPCCDRGGGGEHEVPNNRTAKPSTAQIAALLASELTPSGRASKIAALRKRGAFSLLVKALEPGTVVISWYQVPHGARVARTTRPRPVLVASGRLTFAAAGAATIKIKLTAAGRRLLEHAGRVKLTAKGAFTPPGMAPITALRTFVLKR